MSLYFSFFVSHFCLILQLGKKVVVLYTDEIQNILMKKKLKKSQSLTFKEAETSQSKALEEVSLTPSQVEIVEVGDLDSNLFKHKVSIGGQKAKFC